MLHREKVWKDASCIICETEQRNKRIVERPDRLHAFHGGFELSKSFDTFLNIRYIGDGARY